MLRSVLDTNVVLAAKRSVNPLSPNAEIIARWMAGEFIWLVTDDVLAEYAQKLLEKNVDVQLVEQFLADLLIYGEAVAIQFYHFHHYPVDVDDVAFLLAAVNGNATHLVTYDEHLRDIGVFYPEFVTCEPLGFLADLRTASLKG